VTLKAALWAAFPWAINLTQVGRKAEHRPEAPSVTGGAVGPRYLCGTVRIKGGVKP